MVVRVDPESGDSLEAAARDARYRAMLQYVCEGDCLLSGHHESDQAETLLLAGLTAGVALWLGRRRDQLSSVGWLENSESSVTPTENGTPSRAAIARGFRSSK